VTSEQVNLTPTSKAVVKYLFIKFQMLILTTWQELHLIFCVHFQTLLYEISCPPGDRRINIRTLQRVNIYLALLYLYGQLSHRSMLPRLLGHRLLVLEAHTPRLHSRLPLPRAPF
jgi:hypothetical protein